MDATTSATDSVNNDFRIGKSLGINPSSGQIKDKTQENQSTAVSFTKNEVVSMTESLNDYTRDLQTNLGFSVREEGPGRQIIVEIKNSDTNEVIKQFPPEEMLEIKERMAELVGLIFDQSV
ncbi:MAG: flagellar protein FlaG [Desulfobacteraceae bacterium]|nr:flagellar protein FlaG [Desulfobacteraceae bacterium]